MEYKLDSIGIQLLRIGNKMVKSFASDLAECLCKNRHNTLLKMHTHANICTLFK